MRLWSLLQVVQGRKFIQISSYTARVIIIICCPTHSSFNRQRSNFSGRCLPTVQHSAAGGHVGAVTDFLSVTDCFIGNSSVVPPPPQSRVVPTQ